jgi:AbrB family looped-hinge helix DNA binding protein
VATTVTKKNQVSIPAAIARKCGIRAGSRLEWREGDAPDELVVRVIRDRKTLAERLRGAGKRNGRRGKGAIAELVSQRVNDDQRR